MIQSIIIIFFSFFLLRILFRFKGATKEVIDSDQLIEEFGSFDIKLLISFFLMVPINIVLITFLLSKLSNIGFSTTPTLEFIIRPDAVTWFVISIFLSMTTSVVILILLVKKIKKEKEREYWRYYNFKYGFNATGFLKYLSILIILFMTFLTISQMNSYVKFYTDEIVINESLALTETSYKLGDILEIVKYQKKIAPNGKIGMNPHYGIKFKDGFIWRTTDDLRSPNIKDDDIFNWLLEKTNLELTQIEIDEN